MTELIFPDIVVNTAIDSFSTDVPLVAKAFELFIKEYGGDDTPKIGDIPDTKAFRFPFSTYVDDSICYTHNPPEDSRFSRCCIRGITALSQAVNGFELAINDEGVTDEYSVENLYFYVVPRDKALPSHFTHVGRVTSHAEYSVLLCDGNQIGYSRLTTPRSADICVQDIKWFSNGFSDTFNAVIGEYSQHIMPLYTSIPQSAADAAAYRLGAFYASKCLPRRRTVKHRVGAKANVYVCPSLVFADGSPDISLSQLIADTLAAKSQTSYVAFAASSIEPTVMRLAGRPCRYVPNDSSIQLQPEQFRCFIITPAHLPLLCLGEMLPG